MARSLHHFSHNFIKSTNTFFIAQRLCRDATLTNFLLRNSRWRLLFCWQTPLLYGAGSLRAETPELLGKGQKPLLFFTPPPFFQWQNTKGWEEKRKKKSFVQNLPKVSRAESVSCTIMDDVSKLLGCEPPCTDFSGCSCSFGDN